MKTEKTVLAGDRRLNLSAGFARVDITPPLGTPIVGYFRERYAKGILDPLEANALALSDGERTAVIIAADLLGIEGVEFNAVLRRRIAQAAGMEDDAVYVHSTHTHTGPGAGVSESWRTNVFCGTAAYNEFLAKKLADVASMAVRDMSSATLETGSAVAKRISFIRRYRMKDGSISTNPGVCNPDIVGPVGEPDETVRVLRIRRSAGDIAVVNFATHPDVVGGEMVSGDWPAFVRHTFEEGMPDAKCMFLNGAQGDVNHVCTDPSPDEREGLHPDFDGVDRGYDYARRMGRAVARAALSVWGKCEPATSTPLRFGTRTISVPSQMPRPEDLPLAREYARLHREGRDAEIPFSGMALTTVVAEAERMILLENGPTTFDMPLSMLTLGDSVALFGIPGEPFTGIGRDVRAQSPFKTTICTCLTNGSLGYFPTASAFAEGGYEAKSSPFASSVAERIVAGLKF